MNKYWNNLWSKFIVKIDNKNFWDKILINNEIIENWSYNNLINSQLFFVYKMIIDKYFYILNKYKIINYSINEKNVVFMDKLVNDKLYNDWDIKWWKDLFYNNEYFENFIKDYKLHRVWNIDIWDNLMDDTNIYDELYNVLINDNINEWSNIDTFKAAIKYINNYKWFENNIKLINQKLSEIVNIGDKWFEDNISLINNNLSSIENDNFYINYKEFELIIEDKKVKLKIKDNNFNGGYYKFNRYLKYIDFN